MDLRALFAYIVFLNDFLVTKQEPCLNVQVCLKGTENYDYIRTGSSTLDMCFIPCPPSAPRASL